MNEQLTSRIAGRVVEGKILTFGTLNDYGDYPEDLRSLKYRLMTCLNSTATSHGMAMELTRLRAVQ